MGLCGIAILHLHVWCMKIGINFAFLKDYFRNYAIRQEIVFAKIIGIFSNNAQKRKSTDQVSIGLNVR